MTDTLKHRHSLHFLLEDARTLADVGRRPESASVRRVQNSQQLRSIVNGCLAGSQRFEPDTIANERFSDKTQPSLPFDLPIAPNPPYHPALRIALLGQPFWIGTSAASIMLCWCLLIQSLV